MQILKYISKILICILCILCLHNVSFAAGNMPLGEIGEFGNWLVEDNIELYHEELSGDISKFQEPFQTDYGNAGISGFVPLEAKLGLEFMKALSSIDSVLKKSLIPFTIAFLLIMYAFWVGLEAYKLIRESSDYKKVLYDMVIKGAIIAAWIIVLDYGPAELFSDIITPIIALGVSLSDFILNTVAELYKVDIPNTCSAIQHYVGVNASSKLLIDQETAANIMCLPARLSVYFYHATSTAFDWLIDGFKNVNIIEIFVGIVCVFMFIGCILKYAFMTLGIVADLFLTLLMLPFTAIAESMPESKESNYFGQIFSGLLKVFNTRKLSDVISTFINSTIYFVSLSIVIAICASLLTNIISISSDNIGYNVNSAMTIILCGSLVFYLTQKTDELIQKLGGGIDNSFGEKMQNNAKILWNKAKKFGSMAYKDWLKKK